MTWEAALYLDLSTLSQVIAKYEVTDIYVYDNTANGNKPAFEVFVVLFSISDKKLNSESRHIFLVGFSELPPLMSQSPQSHRQRWRLRVWGGLISTRSNVCEGVVGGPNMFWVKIILAWDAHYKENKLGLIGMWVNAITEVIRHILAKLLKHLE